MENFDLKKYLAEGKLLKEEKTYDIYGDGDVVIDISKATPEQESLIRWESDPKNGISEFEDSEAAQKFADEIMNLNSAEEVKNYYDNVRGWATVDYLDTYKAVNAFVGNKPIPENKLLKERYDKESLLKALGDADDAFIQLSNGRELVIYNPNSNNDENADMWNNDVVYAVSKDGNEVEVLYSDIAGINLEKENMQDADLLAKLAIDILDEFRVYAESEDLIQYLNKSMDYLERIPSNDDVYSAIQAVADGLNLYTGEEFDYEVDEMQSELERLIA